MLANSTPAINKLPDNVACSANECDPMILIVFGMVRMPVNEPVWPPILNDGLDKLNAPYTRFACPTIVSTWSMY